MPVHRSRVVHTRTQRRKLVWATTDQNVNIPAGQISNTNLLATLSVAGSSLLGVTIMRTHLHVLFVGIDPTHLPRIGLVVGRNTDVGINVAGQQDPSNPELDWMHLDRPIPTASGATIDSVIPYYVDNHSKRKMQELNQAYILAMTNTNAAAQAIQIWARVLIALP
jgi:hypothetical protein